MRVFFGQHGNPAWLLLMLSLSKHGWMTGRCVLTVFACPSFDGLRMRIGQRLHCDVSLRGMFGACVVTLSHDGHRTLFRHFFIMYLNLLRFRPRFPGGGFRWLGCFIGAGIGTRIAISLGQGKKSLPNGDEWRLIGDRNQGQRIFRGSRP